MIAVTAIISILVGFWLGVRSRKAWESMAEWSAQTEGFVRFRADLLGKVDRMTEEERRTFLAVVDKSFCSLGDDLRGAGQCCAPGLERYEWVGSPTPTPTPDSQGPVGGLR